MFEIIDKEVGGTIIKVVGVGGAGGNAVDHMIREGVQGVEFITANTDAQALNRSVAPHKVQLGATGLGAGAKPEAGRSAAMEQREQIAEALKGANMVFITAGMGGGTGTGAAPIVAEVARELGILTVAVVTKPFGFEGKRMKLAEAGLAELQQHVDSLIVILNDKLMEVLGDDVSMDEAFKAADNVLRNAVGGIAEIITFPGLVNVDFEDVRTVMSEMGRAMMGSAVAAGVDRARIAAEQAVASPLLEGINLSGAKGVLVNITASRSLKMKEVNEVMNTIRAFAAEDAHIIFGAVFDENVGDALRVTVVATGLGQAVKQPQLVVAARTGTDDMPMAAGPDYASLEVPAVFRTNRSNAKVEAMVSSGVDRYDIPAFLRRQAD
ncbi:cell division protein FtsZ [Oryzomicrobium terrae]|uniref:Cell division protein FtsZ n=1 Tax=Oryzomicrobium terrae TaxID=1735038 RepID=A0A5C1ECV2_9RHOO|nr:cell division protein FtsZ [Oryzomicrobium terrae]QEL65997.1 cell division protein FtsZ [Oryzomicrobium terrae]